MSRPTFRPERQSQPVIIYPAIDIRDGKCVRLVEGDFDRETVFDQDPADAARRWEAEGANAHPRRRPRRRPQRRAESISTRSSASARQCPHDPARWRHSVALERATGARSRRQPDHPRLSDRLRSRSGRDDRRGHFRARSRPDSTRATAGSPPTAGSPNPACWPRTWPGA